MKLFSGDDHAKILEQQIKDYIEIKPAFGSLAIVQIGENDGSKVYANLKKKFCDQMGISVEVITIDENLPDSDIIHTVQEIFSRSSLSGGIIQLPLPRESLSPVLGVIPLEKDIDLLSPESKRRFYAGEFDKLSPAVRSFDYFLTQAQIDLDGLLVGVLGYSELVGKPIAHYASFLGADAEVIGYYEKKKALDYQLIVTSAGVSHLLDPADLANDCSVVDFGFSRLGGKTVGDLDMTKDLSHLDVICPSPGGMEPLVVRFLIMNFLGI
jgi:methylenetetrahydrofolate dehydrogenase (NADP+)/methenyltetrahydrofolate cyclohydrolase